MIDRSIDALKVLAFIEEVAASAVAQPKEWRVTFMTAQRRAFREQALGTGAATDRAEEFSHRLTEWIWDEINRREAPGEVGPDASQPDWLGSRP